MINDKNFLLYSLEFFCYNQYIKLRKRVTTMELKQCVTCGASNFTNGKCDYCRNQYEVNEDKIFYGNSTEDDSSSDEDITFQETPAGKLILKIMIYTLVSIVWFAVTVFIPPLFIITIVLLVVYVSFSLINKNK